VLLLLILDTEKKKCMNELENTKHRLASDGIIGLAKTPKGTVLGVLLLFNHFQNSLNFAVIHIFLILHTPETKMRI